MAERVVEELVMAGMRLAVMTEGAMMGIKKCTCVVMFGSGEDGVATVMTKLEKIRAGLSGDKCAS